MSGLQMKPTSKHILIGISAAFIFIASLVLFLAYDKIQESAILATIIVILLGGVSAIVLVELSIAKFFKKATYTDGFTVSEISQMVMGILAGFVILLAILTVPLGFMTTFTGMLGQGFLGFLRNISGIAVAIVGVMFVVTAYTK